MSTWSDSSTVVGDEGALDAVPVPAYVIPRFVAQEPYRGSGFLDESVSHRPVADLGGDLLVLLVGEPGSGKSVAARSIAQGETAHFEDLRFHTNIPIEPYVAKIFESDSPDVLVIDSLDEWAGSMPQLVRILRNHVFPQVVRGMRLIATCRSADVHPSLQEAFASLSKRLVGVEEPPQFQFQLLPLRRTDALSYVDAAGLDAAPVLASLEEHEAEDLAANAGMLDLICKTLSQDKSVIESRSGLFESAVLRSMDLAGKSVEGGFGSATEPHRLSRVAGVIAAATQLSGKLAVTPSGAPAPGDLAIEEIVGGWDDMECSVQDVRIVLESPLFAQVRDARTFAHKSLSSYLLATFIASSDLTPTQIASLIATPEELGVRASIVTQLRESAVWLIVLDPVRFAWIIDLDAYTIAKYSKFLSSEDARVLTATRLFENASDAVEQRSWGDSFDGLGSSKLTEILRAGMNADDDSQRLAIWIATDTVASELLDELRRLATVDETRVDIRQAALRLIVSLGEAASIANQADQILAHDESNELLGVLIDGLWPSAWSATDLVRVLKKPKSHYFGSYNSALSDIPKSVTPESAEVILDWCAAQTTGEDIEHDYGGSWNTNLAKATLQAMTSADIASIPTVAAKAFWLLIAEHGPLPLPLAMWPAEHVLPVLRALVESCPKEGAAFFYLAISSDQTGMPIFSLPSVDWMVEQARQAVPPHQQIWLRVLERRMNPFQNDSLETAWKLKELPGWDQAFGSWFRPVLLDGDLAKSMKMHAELESKHEKSAYKSEKQQGLVLDKIVGLLDDSESEPERFWEAVYWLDANGFEIDTDLVEKAEALTLGAHDVERIAAASIAYLRTITVDKLPTFEPELQKRPLTTAWRSATTILKRSPERLSELTEQNWNALVVPVLTSPYFLANAEIDGSLVQSLADLVVENSPDRVREVVLELFDLYEGAGKEFRGLDLLSATLDVLDLESLRSRWATVTLANQEILLRVLLRSDPDFAVAQCEVSVASSEVPTELATLLSALAREHPSEVGALFLEIGSRSSDLARDVALILAPSSRWDFNLVGGDAEQTAQLYELWRELFPPDQDAKFVGGGIHTVDARDDAGRLRDSLLSALRNEATLESLDSLRALMSRHPDWDLSDTFAAARELVYQSSWSPVTSDELKLLTKNQKMRVIRSVSELRAATLEALEILQGWLHPEIPQAFALWNATAIPGEPKDENSISDWYCHGLRLVMAGHRVVVNREVEVNRGTGANMGSRNDIRVNCETESGSFVVVIETKRCMNQKLKDGLVEQLDTRYLSGSGLTHGIYLVVCFPFDQLVSDSSYAKHDPETLAARLARYKEQTTNQISVVVHDARLPEVLASQA